MNTYIIRFTHKGKVVEEWERQGNDMEECLADAKLDYQEQHGEIVGVFICRKEV
jgi:hypothetical protein